MMVVKDAHAPDDGNSGDTTAMRPESSCFAGASAVGRSTEQMRRAFNQTCKVFDVVRYNIPVAWLSHLCCHRNDIMQHNCKDETQKIKSRQRTGVTFMRVKNQVHVPISMSRRRFVTPYCGHVPRMMVARFKSIPEVISFRYG